MNIYRGHLNTSKRQSVCVCVWVIACGFWGTCKIVRQWLSNRHQQILTIRTKLSIFVTFFNSINDKKKWRSKILRGIKCKINGNHEKTLQYFDWNHVNRKLLLTSCKSIPVPKSSIAMFSRSECDFLCVPWSCFYSCEINWNEIQSIKFLMWELMT